jgi:hypothetical protein
MIDNVLFRLFKKYVNMTQKSCRNQLSADVLTTVTMIINVLWDVRPRSMVFI